MQLLVSAADARDAFEAALGGADIIDAKDPTLGALGAVSLDRFGRMREVVPRHVPVSAALGDGLSGPTAEQMAAAFARAGAAFVKLGLPAMADAAAAVLASAVRGTRSVSAQGCDVVAAVFADRLMASGGALEPLLPVITGAGARGLLIDTADKQGRRLADLIDAELLARWVGAAKQAGLMTAVAGGLTADQFAWVRASHADIAGVRSAACIGGRLGQVARELVAVLRTACAGSGEPVLLSGMPGRPAS